MSFTFIFVIFMLITEVHGSTPSPAEDATCLSRGTLSWYDVTTGRCFWKPSGEGNWTAGRTACQHGGGDLAVMDTEDLWDHVKSHMNNALSEAWIGLTDEEDESIFRWVNNAPLSYTKWVTTGPHPQPNGAPTTDNGQNCVYLDSGEWHDKDCTESFHYLCSTLATNCTGEQDGCTPSMKIPIRTTLSELYGRNTWAYANETCTEKNQTLLTIDSATKHIEIMKLLEENYDVWLGANDKALETVFRWTDGTIVSWVKWTSDEPSGNAGQLDGNDDCVVRKADGTWYDANCDDHIRFYCETSKVICEVTASNETARDNNTMTCVPTPVYNETVGTEELFSLHVGPGCMDESDVIMSVEAVTGESGIMCQNLFGLLFTDGTPCGGRRACQVENETESVSDGCRFRCPCVGETGCNISFFYGRGLPEVQELQVCEVDVEVNPDHVVIE